MVHKTAKGAKSQQSGCIRPRRFTRAHKLLVLLIYIGKLLEIALVIECYVIRYFVDIDLNVHRICFKVIAELCCRHSSLCIY